jgi:soluble lytic murein transglycosylase-like protein
MSRIEEARLGDTAERQRRLLTAQRDASEPRTIVIRHGSGWQSLAFLCLCLLFLAAVLLGHKALGALERQRQESSAAMAGFERKLQRLESGIGFDAKRRQLLLGMRDHIMRVNPRVSLDDAYRYAELALDASEKYPTVDPLLLLAIGTVESRYDPQARSPADARGLYQIWPSTGRLLLRALGWNDDADALYDPEKNTQAAALYLDILFSVYSDPQLVLAEYNGGPVNAGYFRAGAKDLASETRNYVPQVLDLYGRLKERFESGTEVQVEPMHRDARREGKTLAGAAAVAPQPLDAGAPDVARDQRSPRSRQAR